MAWEARRNGRRYYYAKERRPDGTVRSVYLGRGEVCEVIAECVEERRLEAAHVRRRHRRTLRPIDDALAALRETEAELRVLSRAYLVATGHRAHRGQWRRRRGAALPPFHLATLNPAPMARKKKPAPVETLPVGAQLSGPTGPTFTTPDSSEPMRRRLAEAVAACDTKDPSPADVSRVRDALAAFPASAFSPFIPRVALRQAALITTDGAAAGLAEAEAERFADALTEPDDSPLVRAACETAALARLIHEQAATVYAREIKGSYLLKTAEHLERRMDSTHTRYLRALATVAKLREVERKERRRAELHAERPAARPVLSLDASIDQLLGLPAHAGDGLPQPADVELVAS